MSSKIVFGVLLVVAAVFAAPETHTHKPPTLPGKCPEFKGMENMDISKVDGEWIGVLGAKKGFDKESARCVKKSIKVNPDGSIETTISATKSDNTQKTKIVTGTPIQGQAGQFTLKKENDEGQMTKTVTVLDTDYTDHLVTVVCGSDGTNHGYMVGVYARGKALSAEKIAMIKDHLKTHDNIQDELTPIEQNC